MVAFVLVIFGGINWVLFQFLPPNSEYGLDLVEVIFGFSDTIQEVVYLLIGASAVYLAITHVKECKVCSHKEA